EPKMGAAGDIKMLVGKLAEYRFIDSANVDPQTFLRVGDRACSPTLGTRPLNLMAKAPKMMKMTKLNQHRSALNFQHPPYNPHEHLAIIQDADGICALGPRQQKHIQPIPFDRDVQFLQEMDHGIPREKEYVGAGMIIMLPVILMFRLCDWGKLGDGHERRKQTRRAAIPNRSYGQSQQTGRWTSHNRKIVPPKVNALDFSIPGGNESNVSLNVCSRGGSSGVCYGLVMRRGNVLFASTRPNAEALYRSVADEAKPDAVDLAKVDRGGPDSRLWAKTWIA
ncbi:hypothetical protein BDK51DRAFT_25570, partial [Blyttiomyces helicus]